MSAGFTFATVWRLAFAWRKLLAKRRVIVWAIVLAVFSVALSLTPLLGVLGFEFSFAVALVASIAAVDLSAAHVRRAHKSAALEHAGPSPGRTILRLWGQSVCISLSLLAIPLLIIVLNALRVRQCDFGSGFLFFAMLPGLSVSCATAVGVTSGVLLRTRPRLCVVAAWLLVFASLLVSLWRFYAAPPIFVYDPFAGYFPGALYDEQITLGGAFYWSRLYQALLAACALITASLFIARHPRRSVIAAAAACAALALLLYLFSATLGFAISASDIADALGGKRTTPHFVIVFPKDAPFASEMDVIAQEHEFRFAQLKKTLGVAPRGKITSFYFSSAQQKQRWMGASRTYIAKPWRKEIYVQHEKFPHPVLRHELAHVFAGEFGDPLLGISVKWLGFPPAAFNVGLVEGVAVAADWPAGGTGGMTPHQASRTLLDRDALPPIASLLAPGFFQFSPNKSYTVAGSFMYFLLQTRGQNKLRDVYRAGGTFDSFSSVYGQSLDDLEHEWHRVLQAAPFLKKDAEVARERFRRKAIFRRPCPHAIAQRRSKAARLLAAGRAKEAVRILRRVCRDDPNEPGHRVGLATALERAGQKQESLAIIDKLAKESWPDPFVARMLLHSATVLARQDDLDRAHQKIREAMALGVDDNLARLLAAHAIAFDPAVLGSASLRAYLLLRGEDGQAPDTLQRFLRALDVVHDMPQTGLGYYLVGRVLAGQGAHKDAVRALVRARQVGLRDRLIIRENDRLLTTESFLAGDTKTTRDAAARLANSDAPPWHKLNAADWLERVDHANAR